VLDRSNTGIHAALAHGRTRSFGDQAVARHSEEGPVLAKLDRLIEQARAQLAEPIAFQNELKPLFAAKAMPERKRSTGACLRPLPWLKGPAPGAADPSGPGRASSGFSDLG
jgi:hypothetical protein